MCVELSWVVPDQVWGGRGGAVKGAPMVWAGRVEKGGPQGWGPKPRRSGGSKGGGPKGGA